MREVDEDVGVDGVERFRDRGEVSRIRPRDACDELDVVRRPNGGRNRGARPAGDTGDADADHDPYGFLGDRSSESESCERATSRSIASVRCSSAML